MDLYHIPGDTGKNWRLDKFIEYQHKAPGINYRVMGEYIKKYNFTKDEATMMCWFMSCTYNEVTCILLNEIFDWKSQTPKTVNSYCEKFWGVWKDSLNFGSSRAYAKNMDWFPTLMCEFIRETHNHPYKWLLSLQGTDANDTYNKVCKALSRFKFVGSFARNLFVESVCYIQDYLNVNIERPIDLDWNNCSNMTSGLLNVAYKDEEANYYDKHKKLPPNVTEEQLTRYMNRVQKRIQQIYPDQDSSINRFAGKLCSFRNLFKGARYGGFHHDRELEFIKGYEKILPEYDYLWKRVYELRKEMFPTQFLGEINGWSGIRKERKKMWLREGRTGVEEVAYKRARV